MKTGTIVFWAVIAVLVVGGFGGTYYLKNKPSGLEGFATCIAESGATFYGTFWCPHCQNQKKAFGSAAHLLPYVECSTPDGRAQTDVCKEAGIMGYPTWVFADGSQLAGEVSLADLTSKTGCALPEGTE